MICTPAGVQAVKCTTNAARVQRTGPGCVLRPTVLETATPLEVGIQIEEMARMQVATASMAAVKIDFDKIT